MAFLRADREERSREKEKEKVARAKERAEDMSKIEEMIKHGVQEELESVIQPLQDRLNSQDKAVEDMTRQLDFIMKEVEVLRARSGNSQDDTLLPEQHNVQGVFMGVQEMDFSRGSRQGEKTGEVFQESDMPQARKLCAAARRVIGLTPIEPMMLDIQMRSYGAKNKEEAMLMEVKNYLKCELKVRPSVIEQLDIVKIFHPARDDWKTLYVELGSESEVNSLYNYTKNIKKEDHRVFPYIPKQMYRRYRAVEGFLYGVRQKDKIKTKVFIGNDDFMIASKVPGSSFWKKCSLPSNLPPIEVSKVNPTEYNQDYKNNLIK